MNNPQQAARKAEGDGSVVGQGLHGRDLAWLSERQRTIARLIAQGHTNQQIGAEVNLDRVAVAEEVEQLGRALGVQTRLQLAIVVRQHDAPAASDQPGKRLRRGGTGLSR
jgi:DNA-binding NarL/FixJ family response regulator